MNAIAHSIFTIFYALENDYSYTFTLFYDHLS